MYEAVSWDGLNNAASGISPATSQPVELKPFRAGSQATECVVEVRDDGLARLTITRLAPVGEPDTAAADQVLIAARATMASVLTQHAGDRFVRYRRLRDDRRALAVRRAALEREAAHLQADRAEAEATLPPDVGARLVTIDARLAEISQELNILRAQNEALAPLYEDALRECLTRIDEVFGLTHAEVMDELIRRRKSALERLAIRVEADHEMAALIAEATGWNTVCAEALDAAAVRRWMAVRGLLEEVGTAPPAEPAPEPAAETTAEVKEASRRRGRSD